VKLCVCVRECARACNVCGLLYPPSVTHTPVCAGAHSKGSSTWPHARRWPARLMGAAAASHTPTFRAGRVARAASASAPASFPALVCVSMRFFGGDGDFTREEGKEPERKECGWSSTGALAQGSCHPRPAPLNAPYAASCPPSITPLPRNPRPLSPRPTRTHLACTCPR